jgi:phosphoadenosine phosphosulfate reductase
MDLTAINRQLREASPSEIIRWALALEKRTISTTSFGKNAAVMLHLVQELAPALPVVWVDTGYNLRDTYVVAEKLINSMHLNMQVFTPEITAERRNAIMGGVPTIEDEALHQEFTRQVKLEPFERAISAAQPEVWITGIRKEETDHRNTLDIVSYDGRGILKVAPIFYWLDNDMEAYMEAHELISCRHYFDPTKVHDGRECGLHTSA